MSPVEMSRLRRAIAMPRPSLRSAWAAGNGMEAFILGSDAYEQTKWHLVDRKSELKSFGLNGITLLWQQITITGK